jgi:hypothetical protein
LLDDDDILLELAILLEELVHFLAEMETVLDELFDMG